MWNVSHWQKVGEEVQAAGGGKFDCTRNVLQDGRCPGLDLNTKASDFKSRMLSLILGHRAGLFSW